MSYRIETSYTKEGLISLLLPRVLRLTDSDVVQLPQNARASYEEPLWVTIVEVNNNAKRLCVPVSIFITDHQAGRKPNSHEPLSGQPVRRSYSLLHSIHTKRQTPPVGSEEVKFSTEGKNRYTRVEVKNGRPARVSNRR